MSAALETTVDSRNPWLGLASFTEETRAYFFGRDEEVAELARRVQRKLLTVLFGQSGLGKTSILRAGLVPKLRAQGYCPVYVRIDYAADAPEPADQIKQSIFETASRLGKWSQAGTATAGESLWEFLHHRDDVLKDQSGQTLIPLIIFDQFEEVFTLAQSDDVGRARAARFISDLADLVENRPPRALEARLESDETAADAFDFARSDYRVLIALREDYLAPLESLKRTMPSIAQNRLRLAPMNGRQALAAVMEPGRGMVNEEVASAIVRFVSGGSELQNAEVEPALLSLVCRELNDARIAAKRPEISPDLLEGSQSSILSNFYERSLADQSPAVRRVIEDQLLTASGFRENIAEERLLSALKEAGAPSDTLAVLVNRRLLRVEERLDLRRVELTHDVLCGVVKASRDLRQEREAREASDRLLAQQRDKEAAARKALIRARQIATGCAVLALAAIAAAVIAVVSTQRAKRAEAATQQARVQAESLIGYLSDDFTRELTTYGQLPTIAGMAQREIDYFRGLPPSLKGADSTRNGALAMATLAHVQRSLGDQKTAETTVKEALGLLERLQKDGDASEATQLALARANSVLASVYDSNADPRGLDTSKKARAIVEPIASAKNASEAARRTWGETLIGLGFEQSQYAKEFEDGVKTMSLARQIAADFGAREVKTPWAGALYVQAAVWESEMLHRLGRDDEALAVDTEAEEIGRKVLEKRPDYIAVIHDIEIVETDLAILAQDDLDPHTALGKAKIAEEYSENLLRRDPGGESAINNASVNFLGMADMAWQLGDVNNSLDYSRKAEEMYKPISLSGAWFVLNQLSGLGTEGNRLADAGLDAEGRSKVVIAEKAVASLKGSNTTGSMATVTRCALLMMNASVDLGLGDFKSVRAKDAEANKIVQGIVPNAPHEGYLKYYCDFFAPVQQAEAEMWLGDYPAAASSVQRALSVRDNYPKGGLDDARSIAYAKTLKAIALARSDKLDEARQLIEPQVKFERDLASRNKGDVTQLLEFAQALYAQSLVDPTRSGALRREALQQFEKFPPQFRKLRSTTRWHDLIQRGS